MNSMNTKALLTPKQVLKLKEYQKREDYISYGVKECVDGDNFLIVLIGRLSDLHTQEVAQVNFKGEEEKYSFVEDRVFFYALMAYTVEWGS